MPPVGETSTHRQCLQRLPPSCQGGYMFRAGSEALLGFSAVLMATAVSPPQFTE
jgi:hypothetical protein